MKRSALFVDGGIAPDETVGSKKLKQFGQQSCIRSISSSAVI
jgi:hypothetical protein